MNSKGLNSNKISESLGIHPSTVGPILKNFSRKGSVEHDPRGGRSRMAELSGDRFDQEGKIQKTLTKKRSQPTTPNFLVSKKKTLAI